MHFTGLPWCWLDTFQEVLEYAFVARYQHYIKLVMLPHMLRNQGYLIAHNHIVASDVIYFELKLPNNTPLYIYSCVCVCKKARVIYKQALMHSTNTGAWRITQSIKYSHTHTHLCSYTIKSARIKNLRFMRVILRELKMEFRAVIISHRDTKRNFMLKCWVKSALKLLTVWAQD